MIAVLAISVPTAAPASADDFTIRFPVPSPGVKYIDDFGVFAKGRVHKGVDIFAPYGAPIVAVADGFVDRARYGSNAGYYVVIDHADGWESWSLHLRGFAEGIRPGAFVSAGQVIGWVGNTGNAIGTHPHNHFELHRYGRILNPYPHLVAAWDRQQMEWALEAGETPFK